METRQMSMMSKVGGGVSKGAGLFGTIAGGGGMGLIKGMATKAFLPLAILTTITEVAKGIIKQLQAPGGPWDIRFKRQISEEVASTLDRAEKAKIAAAVTKIRMTSFAGFRGAASSANANAYISGNPIYSQDMESRGKGLN